MDKKELEVVMQKWSEQAGTELLRDVTNEQGDFADFAFAWTKPLWVLAEDGWELEPAANTPLFAFADVENGEVYFGTDCAEDEFEGYAMVLDIEDAEEADQAFELLWNATEELFQDPMPESLKDHPLSELRAWFEICFTPDDEEHAHDCECGEDCDCDDECGDECSCHDDIVSDTRMVTITCEKEPKPQLHCPVCGKPVVEDYCPHVLFVSRNEESVYLSDSFRLELEERGVTPEEFAKDPEQLREDDSWDSDYLFLDLFAYADEEGEDLYVGFHCKWG